MNGFCEAAGFGSARFCRTRTEGASDMAACDQAAVAGPATPAVGALPGTTTTSSAPAPIPAAPTTRTNQFLVIAKGQGKYTVCAADNVPLSQDPSYPGSRCDDCNLREGSDVCE